ncbi:MULTISPECIES: DUF554 domain-containing protein [Aerococcus]|uniref:DUF554 domain-containing protein n=1 Tax=Aerococcus TaxID=1375 RepID=UPI000DCC93BC|nr:MULTISPECIES: DUF554 domain-containing protein [Aerococcus]KAA9234746.1 DUF554 domain-containing protein [Aerococcus mictus]MDK6291029.1 DUF554 domain-containing protein [Aerococcus urinae]MDK6375583.1 DUF554 domain-containing protein [Aerococcus urinae]MDK6421945.1 DUF554 domain-containing protein [Aerococcus urinae]MDK8074477.1 DUF554 domain-containing protein [Aerococcus urinae]
MAITGALVNAGLILLAGVLGRFFGHFIQDDLAKAINQVLGLSVVLIAIQGALGTKSIIVVILSMVVGVIIGQLMDIDGRLNRWGNRIQSRLAGPDPESQFAEGLVTAILITCVGAMGIVGAIQSGLYYDHATLFAKSILDFIIVLILGATYGMSPAFASLPILCYEGGIALLAQWLAPYLPEASLNELSAVGSLLIGVIGLSLFEVKDFKVSNMLPATFIPLILVPLFQYLGLY